MSYFTFDRNIVGIIMFISIIFIISGTISYLRNKNAIKVIACLPVCIGIFYMVVKNFFPISFSKDAIYPMIGEEPYKKALFMPWENFDLTFNMAIIAIGFLLGLSMPLFYRGLKKFKANLLFGIIFPIGILALQQIFNILIGKIYKPIYLATPIVFFLAYITGFWIIKFIINSYPSLYNKININNKINEVVGDDI